MFKRYDRKRTTLIIKGEYMSNTINDILTRRSIKKYKSESIPSELLDKVLEAGTYAPTGRNLQSPIIVAITNKEVRDQLSKMNASIMNAKTDPFNGAPVVLVVLANKDVNTYIYDGSCVMENLMLAAHSLGLGSCWIHRAKEEFESEEGKSLLKEWGIEGNYEGIGHVILGYNKVDPVEKPRKDNYIYYVK